MHNFASGFDRVIGVGNSVEFENIKVDTRYPTTDFVRKQTAEKVTSFTTHWFKQH